MTSDPDLLRRALDGVPLPAAIVDLDALDRNVDRVLAALGGDRVPVRVATKSVRHVGLLRRIVARGGPRIRGVMTYTAHESAFLGLRGFHDQLLAYPIGRPEDARVLAESAASGVRCRVAVDGIEQVELLATAAAERGVVLPLCIDVDLSWRPLASVHLGVRRSPIRSAVDAVRLARAIAGFPSVALVGVLAYEAQVAGIRDRNPGTRWMDPLRSLVKARSLPLVVERRREVVEALRAEGAAIELVNGGGTGSLAFTASDPTVTEVAAGSGFLCSHLFDGYAGLPLEPAAFFGLAVVRSSDPGFVTCLGGGYVASGAAGPDRLPIVHAPAGLVPIDMEGFGEVQTPFRVVGPGPPPTIGDVVLCRHAKAGELAERFDRYHLVRGVRVEVTEPTYRGEGMCFA